MWHARASPCHEYLSLQATSTPRCGDFLLHRGRAPVTRRLDGQPRGARQRLRAVHVRRHRSRLSRALILCAQSAIPVSAWTCRCCPALPNTHAFCGDVCCSRLPVLPAAKRSARARRLRLFPAVPEIAPDVGVTHSEMNDGDETCRFIQVRSRSWGSLRTRHLHARACLSRLQAGDVFQIAAVVADSLDLTRVPYSTRTSELPPQAVLCE